MCLDEHFGSCATHLDQIDGPPLTMSRGDRTRMSPPTSLWDFTMSNSNDECLPGRVVISEAVATLPMSCTSPIGRIRSPPLHGVRVWRRLRHSIPRLDPEVLSEARRDGSTDLRWL